MIISLSPAGLFANQSRLSEHLKVFRDSRATDRESLSQLVCSARATAQPNENLPPNRIREGREDINLSHAKHQAQEARSCSRTGP
jgi:hypothetical protein